MTKIVYNTCYGGFGLSEEAILRYAEIKGLKVYIERRSPFFATYWTAPPEERTGVLPNDENFRYASMEDKQRSNELYDALTIYEGRISRTDPILVQVVEELGEKANGNNAELAIAELPSGTLYRIDEYDGNESVVTQEEYEWSVA